MIRLLILLCLAQPVWTMRAAAQVLDDAGFDAYVTGRTLAFALPDGTPFGAEIYGPDRSVTWSTAPGVCQTGRWYADQGSICFVYDTDPTPRCWVVSLTDRGLRAASPTGTVLFEAEDPDPTLTCPGPDLLS